MSVAVVLLVLRIASAVLLLTFLGIIVWLTYRDLQSTERILQEQHRTYGYLRRVRQEAAPPVGMNGERYPLRPVTTVGRALTNTVVLDDDFTSNEHALLTLRGRQWWLTDLNSRNGTSLNGVPVTTATVISPGDVIGIGDIKLVLEPADTV